MSSITQKVDALLHTITSVRTVWTDRSDFTPLGLFHRIVGRKTACGTQVVGHGYIVALSKARDDARQPCKQCWPGGVA